MQAAVCRHYAAYQDNPHYIPQNRTSLFDRGEEYTLALRRDAMASWLALVEEVVLTPQQPTSNGKYYEDHPVLHPSRANDRHKS